MLEQNLIQQGVQLIKVGELQKAYQVFQHVIKTSPQSADAYHFMGFVSARLNNIPQAIASFEQALKYKPNHADAIVSLGGLLRQAGQIDKAIAHYRRALKNGVETGHVLFHLGSCVATKERDEEAIELLEKSIAMDPGYIQSYMNLAQVYTKQNAYEKALNTYERALEQGLKRRDLFITYQNALVNAGETEKAIDVAKVGLSLNPYDAVLLYNWSRIDASICDDACEQRFLQQDLTKFPPIDQAYVQFVLARCALNRKDYQAEIESLLKGHALFSAGNTFHWDKTYYTERFPRFIQQKKPDLSALSKGPEHRPIFIVGVPRCGSTLVENILCSGRDDLKKAEECLVVSRSVDASDMLADKKKFVDAIRSGYAEFDIDPVRDAFTDKSLENVFCVDVILSLFPNAKVIFCERSPIASIVSILQNNLKNLSWAHDMESILFVFNLIFETMAQWKRQFPDQVTSLVYEELVDNPETVSKALFEFCEMEWDASCLDFYKKKLVSKTASNVQIRSGINKSALSKEDKYKAYLQAFKGQYAWFDEAVES